jgi:hypothetical protein
MDRIAQDETTSDADNARKYAERHNKYASLMYRSILVVERGLKCLGSAYCT